MTFSLRQVLILPYVLLLALTALALGLSSFLAGREAVGTLSRQQMAEVIARIGQAVDRHLVGTTAVLEAAFPQGMPAPADLRAEQAALRERFWIATALHTDPCHYVYYGNRHGQFFGVNRLGPDEAELRTKFDAALPRELARFTGIHGALREATTEATLYDPRERPWYRSGQGASGSTWTSVYIDFRTQELVTTRARRLLGADGGVEGVVATDVSLRALGEFMRQLNLAPHSLAFIAEPGGELIASSRGAAVARRDDGRHERLHARAAGDALLAAAWQAVAPGTLAAGNPVQMHSFEAPDGEVYEAAVARVRDDLGLDWINVVAVPRSAFMGGIVASAVRTLGIGLVGVALAVLIGWSIVNWVARDLQQISRATRAVTAGDDTPPLDIRRGDELGELARHFEAMRTSLRTDRLTGCANRERFMRTLERRIEAAAPAGGEAAPCAVLFIDLVRFKAVNDRLGHAAGDEVLRGVARCLQAQLGPDDLVARCGGDEFLVLLNRVERSESVGRMARRLEAAIADLADGVDPTVLAEVGFGASVGQALFPQDAQDADTLVQRADQRMYAHKFATRASKRLAPRTGYGHTSHAPL